MSQFCLLIVALCPAGIVISGRLASEERRLPLSLRSKAI